MNLPTLIALVLIGGCVLGVVALQLFRKSLADISLEFPDRLYSGGETIDVTLNIAALKNLSWQKIFVGLKCLDLQDRDSSLPHHVLYKSEEILSRAGGLEKGQSLTLPVRLSVPTKLNEAALSITMPENIQAAMAPMKNIAIKRRSMDISWDVYTVIELENLELHDTQSLQTDVMP